MPDQRKPGMIISAFRSTFGFRKTTLSFLVLLSYVNSIFISSYYERKALTVPTPEPSILKSSWMDLEKISESPHPYDSHANDKVHNYILERVNELAKGKDFIQVYDDFNASSIFNQVDVFNSANPMNRVIYFESGNILVKIEGSNPSLEGVLISAHYDSVSTSYGTTDDGMGIASMLGILEQLSSSNMKPLRNIIFNFNNNEEYGLFGAEAFFEHEWSKLVKYFINLEGTGAGGRAVLFRATDTGLVNYFKSVRSPFANSLFQQGFQSGLIRSETDYKVYKEHGMRGVDIAFYKPRNLYHTRYDNIQGTSKGSLWHMMANSMDLLESLSNEEGISTDTSAAVFFDVLGIFFYSFAVTKLYILNIIFLVLVPIISLILLMIISNRRTWRIGISRGWLRLPVALAASLAAVMALQNFIELMNPLILTSDWIIVLVSLTSVFLLVSYLVMNFFSWWRPVHDQKLIVFLELSFLSWTSLIIVTVRQRAYGYTGEYGLTMVYILISIATTFGLLSMAFKSRPKKAVLISKNHSKPNYGTIDDANSQLNENTGSSESAETRAEMEAEREAEQEEHQHSQHEPAEDLDQKLKAAALKSLSYDWSVQFLVFVPLTIFIIYSLCDSSFQGLRYTGQQSDVFVHTTFKLLSYAAVLLAIPLLPFVHKLNFFLFAAVVCGFLIGSIASIYQSPFSSNQPLTVSFNQVIDLSLDNSTAAAQLYGKGEYLEDILQYIPSSNDAKCSELSDGRGVCHYSSAPRPWLVDGTTHANDYSEYLRFEVISNDNADSGGDSISSPYSPLKAEFKIWVPENRMCVMSFNSSNYDTTKKSTDKSLVSPVKTVKIYRNAGSYTNPNGSTIANVQDGDMHTQIPSGPSYDPEEEAYVYRAFKGIDSVDLHKVNFTTPFYHVALEWIPNFDFEQDVEENDSSADLGLHVSCHWGEYDASSLIMSDDNIVSVERKIPAYDEVLKYVPDYVSVSKIERGLVTVKNYLQL